MRQKKSKLCLSVLASIGLLASYPSKASGIPVVDVAGITQMIMESLTRAQEFQQTIQNATQQLNALKDQHEHYKNMVEGHWDIEDILNDPNLNEFTSMDDWRSIYDAVDDIDSLRNEFDLYSEDPAVQKNYDRALKNYAVKKNIHESVVKRSQRIQDLFSQMGHADTPAKKADLSNSIQLESMRIKNDQQAMDLITEIEERERKIMVKSQQQALLKKWRS